MAKIDRRRWMGLAAAGWVAGRSASAREVQFDGADPDLIVRNLRPLDAETLPEAFREWKTPNRLFFVRSHFGPPAEGLAPPVLEVRGRTTTRWTPETLRGFEPVTIPAVLQCSGNGRARFAPRIPGVGWDRGAVGNAEWTGVRLREVLEKAGIRPTDKHVHLMGADTPPNPKTPAFFRSIPLDRALDPTTLVAIKMNGEPLPFLHGGPWRLVVPGWSGNHWIKWLATITLSDEEAPGFYQKTGYRMPRHPVPFGTTVKPEDLVPVTAMNVKSLFSSPTDGARLKAGASEILGVAWTGPGRVAKVEVAIDSGPWAAATLQGPDHEGSWRTWRLSWMATPGTHRLKVRATDSNGETQPEVTSWNRSGYLWNGIDAITCEVSP